MENIRTGVLISASLFVALVFSGCQSEKTDGPDGISRPEQPVFEVVSPKTDVRPVLGDSVHVEVKVNDWSRIEGNITISVDEKTVLSIASGESSGKFYFRTGDVMVGEHKIKTSCTRKNGKKYIINKTLTVLSDIKPRYTRPELVNLYPHDQDAFTQGLTFWDGKLLEGTGLNGKSSVREVDLVTGEVQRIKKLEEQYFGEGITMHKGKLYQLTWQSRVGFIYDPKTFDQVSQFNYSTLTGEGWGITSDGTYLIVSEGTEKLYYLDSNYRVVKRLNVCDNVGTVGYLNELEYFNGHIWANIWREDIIVKIDPETGKVLQKVDIEPLRGEFQPTMGMEVLNGIAIDQNGRFFVTGKKWPRLLEIKIPEKEDIQ